MIAQQFIQWMDSVPAGKRSEAAYVLARSYLCADVDEDTRNCMEAAITLVLDDPSPDVRYALADGLASGLEAPRHVILALAADQARIATLVLSRSPLFVDVELVDLVAATDEPRQTAIASRPRLSKGVSAAIAEVGDRLSCLALIRNPGAAIARISFQRMAERFGDDGEIREALLQRPGLPADVRHALIQRLSEALGSLVVDRSWVDRERARTMTRDACERATVALAAESETEELGALVEHLRVTGQLNTALLLRAVCAGNVAFFETALSILARVPEERVNNLVRWGRNQGLRAIYDKAGLPPMAFEAFVAALDTCRTIAAEGGPQDRYGFTLYMVESVLARYRDITDGEANELTAMLRRFAADQARDAARDTVRITSAA